MGKRNDKLWMERFEMCKRYVEENGGFLPPEKYAADGFALGFWVQRQNAELSQGVMPEPRKAVWAAFLDETKRCPGGAPRNDARWMEMFELYKKYVGEFHKFPAALAVYEDRRLGEWVRNQNTAFRDGFLPAERLALMDSVHPAWKEPGAERKAARVELAALADWKKKMSEGDVALDTVLDGKALEACVVKGIYGCRQYLETFAKMREDSVGFFRREYVGADMEHRFGKGTFSLKNRETVFHAVFSRLDFGRFNLICDVLKAGNDSYLAFADEYQRRGPFASREGMQIVVDNLLKNLKEQEAFVLTHRNFEGQLLPALGKEMGVSTARASSVERNGLFRMRHPKYVSQLKLLDDVELLLEGRGADILEGACVERPFGEKYLDLREGGCNYLPANLTVRCSLDLRETQLEALPAGLYVQGNLWLGYTNIRELPADLVVDGDLYLPAGVLQIPDGVQVGGEIFREIHGEYMRDDSVKVGFNAEKKIAEKKSEKPLSDKEIDDKLADAICRAEKVFYEKGGGVSRSETTQEIGNRK